MALHYYVDLFCDRCGNWVGEGYKSAKDVRFVAKRQGWGRIRTDQGLIDLCPGCQRKDELQDTLQMAAGSSSQKNEQAP